MSADGWRRRSLLRLVPWGAAGALLEGALLSGCARSGPGGVAAAAPTASPAIKTITFAPNWQGVPWNKTAQQLCQQMVDQQFTAQHPGTAVQVVPSTQGAASAQIAATIAGSGFVDVLNDCCADLPGWVASGLLMPLDDRLRGANVDLGQWSALRVKGLNFFGQQLALPAYDGPEVMVYREDMLDEFGLTYPDPGWDYTDAAKLWSACARTVNGKPVYGVSLDNYDINIDYLLHGWGGAMFNANHTASNLNSPQAVAAGEWLFGLIWQGAASPTRDQVNGLVQGRDVFSVCGGWNTFAEATQLGTKFKWNILPQPRWAVNQAAMVNSDFYAINAQTAHPDLAWEFFRWLVAEPTWTRFAIGATLIQPALISLWDEWIATVQEAAPPLKGKGLQYYQQAALGGYEVPQSFFLYNGAQATNILNAAWGQLSAEKTTVTAAFTQVAQQVNALEQTAVANLGKSKAEAAAFPSSGPSIAVTATGV